MLHRKLSVYRPADFKGYDCTNGGVSSRLDSIVVFSADATNAQIAVWCLKNRVRPSDVCRLNKRMLWGEKHYFIEPVKKPRHVLGPMFGGNYAGTSDGTWAEMLGELTGRPLPIHDRFETQEEYDALSS